MAEMEPNTEDSHVLEAGADSPKAALLLVVGEPFSEDQRELILERITTELKSVDAPDCDINAELAAVATQAPEVVAGSNGELLIHTESPALRLDVLINPCTQTLSAKLSTFLQTPAPYHHIIYSGQVVHPSGGWILQDDIFSLSQLAAVSREPEVEVALRSLPEAGTLSINSLAGVDWVDANLSKVSKALKVKLNPEAQLSEINGLLQFSAYLSYSIKVRSMKELLASSDVVGNIRFSRPTLYIFPGAHGDSTLFGISGFNLLINGGFGRKACFWDFARHLDRIDAMLITHLGYDNLFGLSSVLQRKQQENVHPEIGYTYFNCIEGEKPQANGENGHESKMNGLTVNLVEEGNRLIENMQRLNLTPHPCTGSVDAKGQLQPINLYHKIGHGNLDMYMLNPAQDSRELKEFLGQWNKSVRNFNSKATFPLPNACSMCCLLVWRPSAVNDNITRILFPGNVPQARVFEGLEKLKGLDVLQHDMCTFASLHKPPPAKRTAAASSNTSRSAKPPAKAPSARPAARGNESRSAPPKATDKPEVKKAPEPKKVAERRVPAKAPVTSKPVKDLKNKKAAADKSITKPSPSTSSSSTGKITPKASTTPSNTPTEGKSPPPETTTSTGVLEAAIPKAAEKIEQETPPAPSPEDVPPAPPTREEPILKLTDDDLYKPSGDAGPVPVPGAVLDDQPVTAASVEAPNVNLLDTEEACLPEADQAPQSNGDAALEQPEALPDPNQFDNAAFEAIAQSANESLNAKNLVDDLQEEQSVHMDLVSHEPEDQQDALSEKVSCMVFEEEAVKAEQSPAVESTPELSPSEPTSEKSSIEASSAEGETTREATQPQSVSLEPEPVLDSAPVEPEPGVELDPLEPESAPLVHNPVVESVSFEPEPVAESDHFEPEPVAESDHFEPEPVAESDHFEPKPVAESDHFEPEPVAESDHFEPAEPVAESDHFEPAEPVADSDHFEPEPVPESALLVDNPAVDLDSLESESLSESALLDSKFVSELSADEPQPVPESSAIDPEPVSDSALLVHNPVSELVSLDAGHVPESGPLNPDPISEPAPLELDPEPEHVSDSSPFASEFSHSVPACDSPPIDSLSAESFVVQESISELSSSETESLSESAPVVHEPFSEASLVEPEAVPASTPVEPEPVAEPSEPSLESGPVNPEPVIESASVEPVSESTEPEPSLESAPLEPELVPESALVEPEPVSESSEAVPSLESVPLEPESVPESAPVEPVPESAPVEPVPESAPVEPVPESAPVEPVPELAPVESEPVAESAPIEPEPCAKDVPVEPIPEEKTPEGLLADEAPEAVSMEESSQPTKSELEELGIYENSAEGSTPEYSKQLEDLGIFEAPPAQDEVEEDSLMEEQSPAKQPPSLPLDGQGFSLLDGPADESSPQETNPFVMGDSASHSNGHAFELPKDFPPTGEPGQFSPHERDSLEREEAAASFDPLKEWGQPMGLPAPDNATAAAAKKPAAKKPADAAAAKKKPSPTARPLASSTAKKPASSLSRVPKAKEDLNTSKSTKRPATAPEPKKRLSTAPPAPTGRGATKAPGKRMSTATGGRAADLSINKAAPLKPVTPFYVDLTYIPNHGENGYVDLEFFRRVRARYYVLSSVAPSSSVLNALLEAKQTWDNADLEVTLIPTYDTDTLRHWMALHRDDLSLHKISVAPSASRCTIQLHDQDNSCAAYRLEF